MLQGLAWDGRGSCKAAWGLVCVCVWDLSRVRILPCTPPQGLEDQLLAEVVRQERPELEEQRDRLVVSIAADKGQLQELEVRAG